MRRWVVTGVAWFSLLAACGDSEPVGVEDSEAQPRGVLDDFYRRSQLQGHLFGNNGVGFLATVPEVMRDPGLSFPYRLPPGQTAEVPYVSSFTVNRVLGGYHPDWLNGAPRNSRDLIYLDRGTYRTRFELLTNNINLYLDAGYRTSDLTLGLDNVPWDIARPTCADGSTALGTYGNRAPVAVTGSYRFLIRKLAEHLRATYGEDALRFRFKVGVEYNTREAYCGTPAEYWTMYSVAREEIERTLPGAPVLISEIGGSPTGEDINFYDIYRQALERRWPVYAAARSAHYFPNAAIRPTTALAQQVASSFDFLDPLGAAWSEALPKQIHQFGLLGEVGFDLDEYYEMGPRQAAWMFMMAFKLKSTTNLNWLAHWETFDRFLGAGPYPSSATWLLQILDNLQGAAWQVLPTSAPEFPQHKEFYAVSFKKEGRTFVIVSAFTPDLRRGNTVEVVHVRLSPADLPSFGANRPLADYAVRAVDFGPNDNPARYFRGLLERRVVAGAKLDDRFLASPMYLGQIRNMVAADGVNLDEARRRVAAHLRTTLVVEEVDAIVRRRFTLTAVANPLRRNTAGEIFLDAPGVGPGSYVRVYEIAPR